MKKTFLFQAVLLAPYFVWAATIAGFNPAGGFSDGWKPYVTGPDERKKTDGGTLEPIEINGKKLLRIVDRSDICEYGITRTFDISPGQYYRAVAIYSSGENWRDNGAVLSGRFLPDQVKAVPMRKSGKAILDLGQASEGKTQLRITIFTYLGHELLSAWRQPPGYVSRDTW